LDVVELLEEVDACEVVGLPILTEVPQLFFMIAAMIWELE
jgi:hypothetical protein